MNSYWGFVMQNVAVTLVITGSGEGLSICHLGTNFIEMWTKMRKLLDTVFGDVVHKIPNVSLKLNWIQNITNTLHKAKINIHQISISVSALFPSRDSDLIYWWYINIHMLGCCFYVSTNIEERKKKNYGTYPFFKPEKVSDIVTLFVHPDIMSVYVHI